MNPAFADFIRHPQPFQQQPPPPPPQRSPTPPVHIEPPEISVPPTENVPEEKVSYQISVCLMYACLIYRWDSW